MLEPYSSKRYGELDHESANVGLQTTREIFMRSQDNSYKEFFEIPDEVTNSGIKNNFKSLLKTGT